MRYRQAEGKGAACAGFALRLDIASLRLNQLFSDSQSQPRAACGARARAVHPVKALEDQRQIFRIYTLSMVCNGNRHVTFRGENLNLNVFAIRAVFESIVYQISQHLRRAVGIRAD